MPKLKLTADQVEKLKVKAEKLVSMCNDAEKEPKGKGFWKTVFDFLKLIPGLVALLSEFIDMLDGEDDG